MAYTEEISHFVSLSLYTSPKSAVVNWEFNNLPLFTTKVGGAQK